MKLYKAIRPDGKAFRGQFEWNTEPGGITYHPLLTAEPVTRYRIFGTELVDTARKPRKGTVHFNDARYYLSVSTNPTDCPGSSWPCRMLLVEPAGPLWTPSSAYPNKRAGYAFRTIEELPAATYFGPQAEHILAMKNSIRLLRGRSNVSMALRRQMIDELFPGSVVHRKLSMSWRYSEAMRDARCALGASARNVGSIRVELGMPWNMAEYKRTSTFERARPAIDGAILALMLRDKIGRKYASGKVWFTREMYDILTRPWRVTMGPLHPKDKDLRAYVAVSLPLEV